MFDGRSRAPRRVRSPQTAATSPGALGDSDGETMGLLLSYTYLYGPRRIRDSFEKLACGVRSTMCL